MSPDDQIRLPDLPVFRKYSLVLREEFASLKDIRVQLERSLDKINKKIEASAEAKRQTQETGDPPEETEAKEDDRVDLIDIMAKPKSRTQGAKANASTKARSRRVQGVVRVSTTGSPEPGLDEIKKSTKSTRK